mgnify:CR=1 FL=1
MDFDILGFEREFQNKLVNKLESVVRSSHWSGGKNIKSIEAKFSNLYNMHAISCSSGGMALEIISKVFNDITKIGVQSNTYFASILPWINSNKELVLIGTEGNSLTPSLTIIKEAIDKGLDALVLTHIGGYPIPEIIKIEKYCRDNNILLIEDCAHAPLTKIDGNLVGSFGDASILSFFPTKPIPAGEGGMLLIKSKKLANKAFQIRDYGKIFKDSKTLHRLPAVSNGRLNEFSAAIVSVFLENYNYIYEKRKKICEFYNASIPDNLIYQYNNNFDQDISFYKYITFLKSSKYEVSKVYDLENQLYSILRDNDIKFIFIGENPYGVEHLCLPVFPNMNNSHMKEIIKNIVF